MGWSVVRNLHRYQPENWGILKLTNRFTLNLSPLKPNVLFWNQGDLLLTYLDILLQLLYVFLTTTFWVAIANKPRNNFCFVFKCTRMLNPIPMYVSIQQLSFRRVVFDLFYDTVLLTKVWVFSISYRPIKEIVPLVTVKQSCICI